MYLDERRDADPRLMAKMWKWPFDPCDLYDTPDPKSLEVNLPTIFDDSRIRRSQVKVADGRTDRRSKTLD